MVEIIITIFIGFLVRVYFTSKGTFEYSRETASKKVTATILFMIVLSLLFNIEFLDISSEVKDTFTGICAAVYYILALLDSFNSRVDKNTWVSFVKLILLFCLSVSNSITMLVISFIFLAGMVHLYKKQYLNEDADKITFVEIVLLCVENILFSIIMLFFIGKENMFSTILIVAFEETVLYSLNYIVLFTVKEKIYSI